MSKSSQILRMLVAAVFYGCLLFGQTRPSVAPQSTNLVAQTIDQFAATLPGTVIPVVSPKLEAVATPAQMPSAWREYRNKLLGFSFKYPPELSLSTTANSNVGVDCASQNTVCLYLRREGGKEEFFSVDSIFSVTATGRVSPMSCLSPTDAFRDVPYKGATAQTLAELNGVVFRKSDCGDAGLGTTTECYRYDVFANHKCYELIPQLSASCGGTSGQDLQACGAEADADAGLLKATLATFTLTKPLATVDPRRPVPNKIAYDEPATYREHTIEHGDTAITFEYPDDPRWKLVDDDFQPELVGQIPLGGAQIASTRFIAISFDPGLALDRSEEYGAKHFIKDDKFGFGWALNSDIRYPHSPKAVCAVSAGPNASGYFVLEYAATGRVNSKLAFDINTCHASSCPPMPRHLLLFEFRDVNNNIAKRFLSSLQIRIDGTTSKINLGERVQF